MAKSPPVLTEQELEIMKVVWDRESVTVRDVYETLRAQRQIAYTTVMTMMRILERKGHVKVSRADRAFVYRPARARQRVVGEMVREFVDRVFGGAAEPLVQHLVRDRHLTEDDLKEIATHLKSKKSEGEEMSAELLAANIAAHWVQSGVVAVAAIIAMRVMHLHAPRARLAALQLTVVAIVTLPIVQPMRVDEPAPRMVSATQTIFFDTVVYEDAGSEAPGAATWLTPARAALAIVLAGIFIRLAWLFYGITTLARFSRAASDIPPPSAANDLEAALQLSPRYVQQTGSRAPWTFGWLRPTVALPSQFDALAPEFQRAVICHELLHIKRRDIACAFVEELAIAALWFHPWMWLLRARIRVTREQAVDSRVVAMLDNRDDYVRCLVDLSGHDLAPHFSQAGAGMLRPRELRARVDAIFQEVHMSRLRVAVAAFTFVAVTFTTGFAAVAAMPLRGSSLASASTAPELPMLVSRYLIGKGVATPIQSWAAARLQFAQAPAAPDAPRKQINKVYPEYPHDALERGIKGLVVVDITVNAAGDVSTAGVVSGPQELRASALKTALGLKFTPGTSTTAMKISVEYTLTGNSWGVRIWDSTADGMRRGPIVYSSRGPENPMPAAARVGGDIRPPRKIKDAPPTYPAEAQAARVQGVVILEARVDENGNVSHTHVLRSIPLLDQAAIDAVKQWQYTPTLMNGVAVPIIMTVTVNFTLRERLEMRVVLPDGNSMALDMPPVGMVKREFAGAGVFQLRSSRERESNDVTVSVFTEDGQTHLGDVVVTLNGPVVQLPTTPSLGLQFIAIR